MIRQPSSKLQTRRELVETQLAALPKVNKPRKDGSAVFKCVGGAYHDIPIRMYAPWPELVHPITGDTYTYSSEPISRRSKAHVYINTSRLS